MSPSIAIDRLIAQSGTNALCHGGAVMMIGHERPQGSGEAFRRKRRGCDRSWLNPTIQVPASRYLGIITLLPVHDSVFDIQHVLGGVARHVSGSRRVSRLALSLSSAALYRMKSSPQDSRFLFDDPRLHACI
jgi:hypothetical protein